MLQLFLTVAMLALVNRLGCVMLMLSHLLTLMDGLSVVLYIH